MRLLKVLVVLILAAVIGLVGYAYLGDMQPVRSEVRSPIGAAAPVPVPDQAAPAEDAATSE
ncbi:hypothetical protein EYE42_02280 [Paracoccus subflavus]|uniref:Uncharacterized protein n=1 Tax=Paracoccus subflavus TaxID=2528244 RepID=A0A4Q9G5H9_9RHOB|nr:hypothetical protein [Paracoccus subflavus]TBN43968.1 hypothetical protein EYE42_02280 [Paracoccus subflavus]